MTRDDIRNAVLHGGMTLRNVLNDYTDIYREDRECLEALRLRYISENAEMPATRANFYIDGSNSAKAEVVAIVMAGYMGADSKNSYFKVKPHPFNGLDGYDGEPVIVWDNFNAKMLLHYLGGRRNVFDVFSILPKHVWHSQNRLNNAFNFIIGAQPYKEFIDEIGGYYIDENGEKRATEGASKPFSSIIELKEEDLDAAIRKGMYGAEGKRQYAEYLKTEEELTAMFKKEADRQSSNKDTQ